ncbi:unnamed protein product, partial [Polarella glacialis]
MEGTARDALAAEEALSDMRQARSKGEVSVSAADAVLPSPLRQRATRSSSPAPVTPFSSAASATRVPRAGEKLELKVNSCDAASRHQDKTEAKQPRRLGLPSGLALLAAAAAMMLWPKLSTRSSSALRSEDLALRSANSSEESRAPATVEVGPEASPSLPALVAHALACPGARADVLDVLAGAPYEFGDGVLQDQAFYRLPRLAAAAAQAVDEAPFLAQGAVMGTVSCFTDSASAALELGSLEFNVTPAHASTVKRNIYVWSTVLNCECHTFMATVGGNLNSTAQPGVCRFAFSADVSGLVRCQANRLLPRALAEELIGDEPLDIEADLVVDGEVLQTSRSAQVVFDASPEQGDFRPQQFVFAIKVRDLPLDSRLAFRLRPAGTPGVRPCVYRGALPLFNERAVLRQGRRLVALLPDSNEAGGSYDGLRDSNEAAVQWLEDAAAGLAGAGGSSSSTALSLSEALRLEEACELRRRGWLPAAAPGLEGSEQAFGRAARETLEASGLPWLSVQLPVFQHPVVFAETQYGQEIEVPSGVLAASNSTEFSGGLHALQGPEWLLRPLRPSEGADRSSFSGGRSFKCYSDYGASLEHPALLKSLRLARSSRASRVKDRDARPNAEELRRLAELVRRPRRQFSAEEKHLLFRFRWSLTDQPGALTKFLHAVDWSDLEERQHAIELLGHWSPVDIDDALELLSKDFRGVSEVRRHAVRRLERASDADLQLYLLQLVQALRYEPVNSVSATNSQDDEASASPPTTGAAATTAPALGGEALTQFLIRRAVNFPALATLFHWYVVAEKDGDCGGLFETVRQQLLDALGESAAGRATRQMLERQVLLRQKLLWCVQCAK